MPLTIQDTRTGGSAAAGWNVTITSVQFTSGGHTLASNASHVTAATTTCVGGASCVNPTNAISHPLAVPAAATPPTAVKLYSAATGTGTGIFSLTPTIGVTVPANSYARTYTSTLTIALISGP